MESFRRLEDTRFSEISKETKERIVKAIINDIPGESKFTQKELERAWKSLVAREASVNQEVKSLIKVEDKTSNSVSINPFSFNNNDPFLLWYVLNNNAGAGSYGNCCSSCAGGGGSCDCKGDGICYAILAAIVCFALVCCSYTTYKTATGSEEKVPVKVAKITTSTLAGLITAIAVGSYLFNNNVWHDAFFEKIEHPSEQAYHTCLVLIAGCVGLLTSGTIAIFNNIFRCPPRPPKLSVREQAAARELEGIMGNLKELLASDWATEGEDVSRCHEFIREVVRVCIEESAATPVAEHGINMSRVRLLERDRMFSDTTSSTSTSSTLVASAPPAPTPTSTMDDTSTAVYKPFGFEV